MSQTAAKTTLPPVTAHHSTLREAWRKKHLYLLLLPMLAFLITFSYLPAVDAVYFAFFEFDGIDARYIGLQNFAALLSDDTLRASLWNLARLIVFHLTVIVWVPFFVAELIFNVANRRLQYFYRVMFVIPMVVPSVAIWLIWKFIYEPNFGVLNTFLRGVGLEALAGAWFGDPGTALYAVMGVGFPWVGPFALLVYFAGLQSISRDILDASTVDGCSGFRRLFSIDIPLTLGQIKVIFILQLIGTLQSFVNILILTNGGPADATMVPGLQMYRVAFLYYKMGYGSAIGVVLLIIVAILTYLSLAYRRPAMEYGDT